MPPMDAVSGLAGNNSRRTIGCGKQFERDVDLQKLAHVGNREASRARPTHKLARSAPRCRGQFASTAPAIRRGR